MEKLVIVEVLSESFGRHEKGDEIKMNFSTAKACEKHNSVKIISEIQEEIQEATNLKTKKAK